MIILVFFIDQMYLLIFWLIFVSEFLWEASLAQPQNKICMNYFLNMEPLRQRRLSMTGRACPKGMGLLRLKLKKRPED